LIKDTELVILAAAFVINIKNEETIPYRNYYWRFWACPFSKDYFLERFVLSGNVSDLPLFGGRRYRKLPHKYALTTCELARNSAFILEG
jgi:hypothetical protein